MPPKPTIRLPRKSPAPLKAKINSPPTARFTKPGSWGASTPLKSSHPKGRTPPPPPPPLPPNDTFRRYRHAGTTMFFTLCTFIWLRDHWMSIDTVRGSSMAPTLSPEAHETGKNDWVLIRRYMERDVRPRSSKTQENSRTEEKEDKWRIKRGDIITFWKPHRPEEISIKRVIALEGDTVYPRRGYALDSSVTGAKRFGFTDGLPVDDPDAISSSEEEKSGKVVVPFGHVWVEGDNWRKSYDSNDFGPISKGLIDGKAVKIWRGWWKWVDVGDGREKGKASRVVEGRMEAPRMFLE